MYSLESDEITALYDSLPFTVYKTIENNLLYNFHIRQYFTISNNIGAYLTLLNIWSLNIPNTLCKYSPIKTKLHHITIFDNIWLHFNIYVNIWQYPSISGIKYQILTIRTKYKILCIIYYLIRSNYFETFWLYYYNYC